MQVCDKFVSAETPLFTMFFVFFKLPVTKSQSFCSKNERGKGGWQRRHAVVKYALSIKVTSDILSAVCGNEKSGAADITPQHRSFANMNMIMTRMVLQSLFDFRDTWLALQPL